MGFAVKIHDPRTTFSQTDWLLQMIKTISATKLSIKAPVDINNDFGKK
jgi:hypothetical protein